MYEESKKELVRICHLLYDKNLVTAADGNVSVRVSKGHILLTPSGKGKGFVEEKDILVLDLEGNLVEGSGKPSREYPMHRAVYEERPEVGAVVHTHPVFATAFAMAGKTVPDCYLIETKVALKGIALADLLRRIPWSFRLQVRPLGERFVFPAGVFRKVVLLNRPRSRLFGFLCLWRYLFFAAILSA